MSDFSEKVDSILAKLDSFKDELVKDFEDSGLGKDILLDVHNALDGAHARIASAGVVEGHDLNVDLAERPEDHPAPQGQQTTPINTDDNVNQASPVDSAQPVISGAPQDAETPNVAVQEHDGASVGEAPDDAERRVGSDDEPHAPQAA